MPPIATYNSEKTTWRRWSGKLAPGAYLPFVLFACFAGIQRAAAQSTNHTTPPPQIIDRVEKAFDTAKARYDRDTNSFDAAWQLGRACYDRADAATTSKARAEAAQMGIDACNQAIRLEPSNAVGHLYMAMLIGELAQTKTLGALKLITQIEQEFSKALELDPKLDYAGPDRGLGLLYFQTPGWPISLGSNAKAKQHLEAAVKIAPDYPENLLNLLEAELKWGDHDGAAREIKAYTNLLPSARARFTGPDWESSWLDWDKRWTTLKDKAGETTRNVQPTR